MGTIKAYGAYKKATSPAEVPPGLFTGSFGSTALDSRINDGDSVVPPWIRSSWDGSRRPNYAASNQHLGDGTSAAA
ncbi:MAG TPA: hypothetical protein VGZ47_21335, partial [Gemmataceae bacterium]|jgi:hypothetical protein|nr:hypothetical protein [Gemmataceae bacterium]